MTFTHFNKEGRARMVDVSGKEDTTRVAIAQGIIQMKPSTIQRIKDGYIKKGDVLSVAQIGGVMGAKQTGQLIPMCHPLFLSGVDLSFELKEEEIIIEGKVKTVGKTGVEMEALTGVSITALTIYDMCKSVDKDMVIKEVKLISKTGGKSGDYIRK
nr:cyclic pyranopterin monophosphate synthase MoaC [Natranaerovirga pectinivora]